MHRQPTTVTASSACSLIRLPSVMGSFAGSPVQSCRMQPTGDAGHRRPLDTFGPEFLDVYHAGDVDATFADDIAT